MVVELNAFPSRRGFQKVLFLGKSRQFFLTTTCLDQKSMYVQNVFEPLLFVNIFEYEIGSAFWFLSYFTLLYFPLLYSPSNEEAKKQME